MKNRILLILVALVFTLSGCDFFRSLVGKPTSADLERIRQASVARVERQRQMADSLKSSAEASGAAASDTAASDTAATETAATEASAAEAAATAAALESVKDENARYHVIAGSFKVPENAAAFIALMKEKGYTPKSIRFRNGYEAVSVYEHDNFYRAVPVMKEMRTYEYCPDDVWIYDLKQNLHE